MHPEKIPSNVSKFDNFNFSFSQAAKEKESLTTALQKLEDRIDNITSSEKFFVADMPILKSILGLSPSKNELKKLSKALDRLSDLVDLQNTLKSKLQVHDAIIDHPNWFVETFGDFSNEIEEDIEKLFNDCTE